MESFYDAIKFLKELLPEPAALGPLTQGRTCIGCLFKGVKNDREKQLYIYNICSHEEAYREVGSQAISYITGVPAMIGAMMMLTGAWKRTGVWNMEEFDPDPFMAALTTYGLAPAGGRVLMNDPHNDRHNDRFNSRSNNRFNGQIACRFSIQAKWSRLPLWLTRPCCATIWPSSPRSRSEPAARSC